MKKVARFNQLQRNYSSKTMTPIVTNRSIHLYLVKIIQETQRLSFTMKLKITLREIMHTSTRKKRKLRMSHRLGVILDDD